ncbi:argonaute siRNA chaperone complex subunit Arb1 [Colletotrichum karsti]|uniref:Argonaute siRNA chaperone complex subunit Arb1 n=1 Tax=Colletotrichum karsti TaxID=1095194 RepID=A0A9P6LDT0_9PEZI|nr:argonaute siRNA chaperone complex subunit Arb1 [Colletotrichum karsti]KAF9872294.1 argonaute siRNA chaperone complex subunit Arb1 [Colletotrichum karsti]
MEANFFLKPHQLTGFIATTATATATMAGKKSTASRGPTALPKYRGTGFEEYYADPPMTAEEAREEKENIYNPSLPFVERIQACIQRFRSRRRISGSEATQPFNQYLFLGGVDTSPRLFGGNTDQDVQDMTPDERRTATATDVVYNSGGGSRFYSADDPEGWDVDFAGVVAGFLSENLAASTSWDYLRMGKAIGIIENFLNYVLQHDVCPEYADNIRHALSYCDRAKIDLPLTHQALISFPGQFNLAMCELFCPDFFFINEGEGEGEGDNLASFKRRDDFNPAAVAKLALAVGVVHMGVDKVKAGMMLRAVDNIEKAKTTDEASVKVPKVLGEENCSMEVADIHRAPKSLCEAIGGIRVGDDMTYGFTAMGKLVLRPCIIQDGYDHGDDGSIEATKANDGADERTDVEAGTSDVLHTFIVDDDILGRLQPGFKMQLCIVHLDNGVSFIKQVRSIFVAWHTFLPQNLMAHFKEPVANDRPAPSVANPNAEEYDESLEKSFGSA